ncbi:RagB/SusD family nutrient uptake outer membrane protein [Olivibacter sp. XZL3]|uniref:RagB/SusD family nutrient uptake outer membrane protein n=1 Tax=Olivibacter sp. XZL3 TaxID=1735116 RepID=UPI001F0F339F|nr:RagB/SusD family nutrient uptake outer membrane protein [Olivibacter sp. XZL3]
MLRSVGFVYLYMYNRDDNDIHLIRYAEVLLNYAEARMEQVSEWNRRFEDPKNYLWPVPQPQLDRNPNLGQNPGW